MTDSRRKVPHTMGGRRQEDRNWLLQPARRIYVAVLFVFMIIALSGSYYYLQHKFHTVTRQACERADDVRRESNQRIPEHKADEQNLLSLLTAITHTRELEAVAWHGIFEIINTPPLTKDSHFYGLNTTIKTLIATYDHAEAIDASIRAKESKIKFDNLRIVNCNKVT